MDAIKLLLLFIGLAAALGALDLVAWLWTRGAVDTLEVARRTRVLFQAVVASGGQLSASDVAERGRGVEHDLRALQEHVADWHLRRSCQLVVHHVVAARADAAAPLASQGSLAIRDLYKTSGRVDQLRARRQCDDADQGLRAVDEMESRAAFLAKVGKVAGRSSSTRTRLRLRH